MIPRKFWLDEWEKQAIIAYYLEHEREGYRRVTFMMLDADVVAVSPSSTYRVLKAAGLMRKWERKQSKKGRGSISPYRLTSIGISTFLTSIYAEHSTISAVSWMAIAVTLCTGKYVSR